MIWRILLLVVAGAVLSGCVSEHAESIAQGSETAIRGFAENADSGFDEAVRWGVEGRRDAARWRGAVALLEEAEPVDVVVGKDWLGRVKTERRAVLSTDQARETLDILLEKVGEIDQEADKSRALWSAARVDLEDGLEQLARLKRLLEVAGLSPEQVDALGEGLARELRRRKGD